MRKKIIIGILLFSGLVFAAAQTKYYGDILMQGHKILGLATDASDSTSATTKGYVDAELATKLPLSGGSSKPMTGNLYMGTSNDKHQIKNVASPSSDYDAANKTWTVNTFLPRSGGNITGTIDMNFHPLINPATNNIAWNYVVNRRYVNQEDERVAANANAALTNLAAYVDAELATKLPLSGGSMSGTLNMCNQKITSLKTPTASADAATKAYVDSLVLNSPSLIDSFLFYSLNGSVTNSSRIFDVASTGGYINVSMLADNPLNGSLTATLSDTNDAVSIVRNGVTIKAGSGFKLWLTSPQTNDHFTSISVRDSGNGAGICLARVKSIDVPDWSVYVHNASGGGCPCFTWPYVGDYSYDISKAYYSGMFIFEIGVSNVTRQTIKVALSSISTKHFYNQGEYPYPQIMPGNEITIPPHTLSNFAIYIASYDHNDGASISFELSSLNGQIRKYYRTFWSWSGMQPDQVNE